MRTPTFVFLLLILVQYGSSAQDLVWQKSFGGAQGEGGQAILQMEYARILELDLR